MSSVILSTVVVFAYAALPTAWGLRAWAVTGLVVIWAYALSPETPFQDQGFMSGFGAWLALSLLFLASLGVGCRMLLAVWQGRLIDLDPAVPAGLQAADELLAGVAGLVAGLCATLLLAATLRGMPGGLLLHLAIALLAFLAILAARRLPVRPRILTIVALATVACLTLAGGTLYPRLILAQAEALKVTGPRCLRTPDGTTPMTDDLRLLTLPQARSLRPNLVLTVMANGEQRDFRWSYRASAFRSYDSYDGGPCPAP
jgi:hypothetical protein